MTCITLGTVSYTHLDVYKRQRLSKVRDPVADTALWISREYGASIFQAFNALSDGQRRISIALELSLIHI